MKNQLWREQHWNGLGPEDLHEEKILVYAEGKTIAGDRCLSIFCRGNFPQDGDFLHFRSDFTRLMSIRHWMNEIEAQRPGEDQALWVGHPEPLSRGRPVGYIAVAIFREIENMKNDPQSWPDWKDAGKRVEIALADGTVIEGKLEIEDFFPDGLGGETPVFVVIASDGRKYQFVDAKQWTFKN